MGRGRLAGWVGGAAAIAVAVLACRQLVGIGDEPPPGPGGTATDAGAEGGFTYGQGDCAACVTTNCATEATACAGTPSCAVLESCMSGCGTDPTCRAQCGVDHGLGNDMATPGFEACLASHCETQCGLTCGGLAAVFPPATAIGCEACFLQQECPGVTACATNPGCQATVRCEYSTTLADVQEACPGFLPDGGFPFPSARTSSLAASCSSDCSWGADWSCVGNVHWPNPTEKPITFPSEVVDFVGQTPIDDATVTLCNQLDPTCMSPLTTALPTGDAGTITFIRGSVSSPLFMYFEIAAPTIVPTIGFDAYPISQQRLTDEIIVLTPDELADLAGLGQVTLTDGLGSAAIEVVDCRLAQAPGVALVFSASSPTSKLVYAANDSLDPTKRATDVTGTAVLFNAPVTPTTPSITVTANVGGRPVATTSFFVRPGGDTEVYLPPTPL
jgi:hypothetical protein